MPALLTHVILHQVAQILLLLVTIITTAPPMHVMPEVAARLLQFQIAQTTAQVLIAMMKMPVQPMHAAMVNAPILL